MMSTSIPTNFPSSFVNSKGGKTVSVAIIYFSPVASVPSSVPSVSVVSPVVSSLDEHPARTPRAITATSDKASNFFFIFNSSFLICLAANNSGA